VKGGADGTGAGVKFAHHAFYLLSKTGFVQVKAEDILTAEKGLEADPNNAQFKNMVKHIDSLFSEEEKA
jgi:hypothetical protein